jgi:membrane protein implicated in regulation of membrane protease activity
MGESGMGLGTVLFIVFLILKLIGSITWSWWWVTAPLWIGAALWLFWLGVIAVVALIVFAVHKRSERRSAYSNNDIYRRW